LRQWGTSWPRERVCRTGGIRKNCGNLWKSQKPQVQNQSRLGVYVQATGRLPDGFLVFLVFSQRSPLRFFLDLQTIRTIREFLSGLKFHDFVLYVVEVKASNAPILSCLDDQLARRESPHPGQGLRKFVTECVLCAQTEGRYSIFLLYRFSPNGEALRKEETTRLEIAAWMPWHSEEIRILSGKQVSFIDIGSFD
jgi:hypothetical protein